MSEPPLILFATIAAGGGHVATAKAMMQAIEKHYPGAYRLELSDLMLDLGFERFDRQHKETWKRMLRFPLSARLGQRLIDRLPGLTVAYHRRTLRAFAEHAAGVLKERAPALIVANHAFLSVALTMSQRDYGLTVPVVTFATEPLDASALWAEPRAELFVTPSEAARADLLRMGVPPERIDVVGYPVQEAFLGAPRKEEARATLGLNDSFTCLVSLGGEGMGPNPMGMIEALLAQGVQTVVLTGRNEGLLHSLQARPQPLLHAVGFSDKMAQYLAAADVVLGKAGPASVMEALAVGRPLLVTTYAGLNEQKLLGYLEKHGFGRFVAQAADVGGALEAYRSEDARRRLERQMAALDLPGMTEHLAHYLVAYLRTGARQGAGVGLR